VAVVLSGTGSDGSAGVRAIQENGGFVLAQTSESAQFQGMPESAAATGQVDLVVSPRQMMAEIRARFRRRAPQGATKLLLPADWNHDALQKIFALLKAKTTHDFTHYKPSTIQRRIVRRMALKNCASLEEYRDLVDRDEQEVDALFDDLLIGVTSFFRDPAVYEALAETAVPRILSATRGNSMIRVWSAGCSTGEEAYSLAILLNEGIEAQGGNQGVQVFATDIDKKAIDAARLARYPASIAEDVSRQRLRKSFSVEPGGKFYKVQKHLRDAMVFSEHDLIKDPPFFKLDLLVCRNLLIYLGLDLQKTILPMFHYALNPGGILVLGTSETIGEFGHLFEALDRTNKVYARRETLSTYPLRQNRYSALPKAAPRSPGTLVAGPIPKDALRDLAEQTILEVQDMAAAVVNAQGEILYLHGRTGSFLEPPQGAAGVNNILKMAKEGLKYPMATALHQAGQSGKAVRARDLPFTWKDQASTVHLGVHPIKNSGAVAHGSPLFLILMEESPVAAGLSGADPLDHGRLAAIQRELATKEKYLETASEEMEASNEELRSSNEELQSVNEELQSSNEELETQREELQSVNEELSTVNVELVSKMAELTTTNNDMNNLLAATGIATVFVDLKLNILRFTPEANRVLNLIPGDVGRPVGHLASNLVGYQGLERDAQAVLDSLVAKVLEVQSRWDVWYRLRIQPYRTLDHTIEGAVISFVDITEIVRQRETLRQNNERLRLVSAVQDSRDAIVVHSLDGQILAWNPGAARRYGWTEAEALGMNIRDHFPEDTRTQTLEKLRAVGLSEVLETYQTKRKTKDGRILEVSITSSALMNQDHKVYAICHTERVKGAKLDG